LAGADRPGGLNRHFFADPVFLPTMSQAKGLDRLEVIELMNEAFG
jgi:hypothetical protein